MSSLTSERDHFLLKKDENVILQFIVTFGGMADELHSRNVFLTVLEASFMILLNVLSLLGNVLVCLQKYRTSYLDQLVHCHFGHQRFVVRHFCHASGCWGSYFR